MSALKNRPLIVVFPTLCVVSAGRCSRPDGTTRRWVTLRQRRRRQRACATWDHRVHHVSALSSVVVFVRGRPVRRPSLLRYGNSWRRGPAVRHVAATRFRTLSDLVVLIVVVLVVVVRLQPEVLTPVDATVVVGLDAVLRPSHRTRFSLSWWRFCCYVKLLSK